MDLAINKVPLKNIRDKKKIEAEYFKQRKLRTSYLRKLIIDESRIDLLMTEVLGYTKLQDFHMLMWLHRQKFSRRIEKQLWHLALAPRGGGKTSILTISDAILSFLQNPNIRILFTSKTDENAVGFLTEVKQKITSPEFIEVFGDHKGNVWNDGEINIATRNSTAKEKTIGTVGYSGALASKHFDKIYADDLVDSNNSATETQRKKLYDWFYTILDPTLAPDGQMLIAGTRYHPSDLYGQLISGVFTEKSKDKKEPKTFYIRVPALIRKKQADSNAKLEDKYISFWPDEFSVKFLLKKRRDQGAIIFNQQMQNDVKGMKGKIFRTDWFRFYRPDEIKIKNLKIFSGVDLAIKQSDKADKFAHITLGVDPKTMNIFILSYYNQVTHFTDQKRIIYERFIKFDDIRVGIESNGYQRSLIQDLNHDPKLSQIRAVPIYTEQDKVTRAWKLSAYFERGQVYMLEDMVELQEHLLGVPDGRYFDLFDALDIAIRAAIFKKKRSRDYEPGVITPRK